MIDQLLESSKFEFRGFFNKLLTNFSAIKAKLSPFFVSLLHGNLDMSPAGVK